MRRTIAILLTLSSFAPLALTQTPQKTEQQTTPDEVVRITTRLVQTDVVVTDKSDQIINDLKLDDFDLYDNGKKQELKFMEFVSVDTGVRAEGTRPPVPLGKDVVSDQQTARGLAAKDVRRVVAYVIDDLTIPVQDVSYVRKMLFDFVDNQMRDGDLVAIVRVIGGKGLLQQFTSDRTLLKRAIAQITPSTHPLMAFGNPDAPRFSGLPTPVGAGGENSMTPAPDAVDLGTSDISSANDETNRLFRGLSALSTAGFVIDSLKEIPGRKNMVIVSGGIPIFETNTNTGSVYSNVTYLLNQLTDNAIRAGVVINTLDPRGLRASPGVAGFQDTPAHSALDINLDPAFGRGGSQSQAVFGGLLAGGAEHLGLNTVANATGGVSVVNTNNFEAGIAKILARSRGYYTLAYTPTEKFDKKFHQIEVKVRRGGVKVYGFTGYYAREDQASTTPRTKEEEVAAAAKSPLAKRDIDVTPNVTLKMLPDNKGVVDVHMRIDIRNLHFAQAGGRYQTSLDTVGFLFDQYGRRKGGISDTINLDLTPEVYQRSLVEGFPHSASAELQPGYYQVRFVVREASSGSLGTFSKYLEIPDLTKGRLAMSSLFLYAIDPTPNAKPEPLLALRQLTTKQELRYAAMVYNPKLKDGKPQVHSQVFITQGAKVLYTGPDEPLTSPSASTFVKLGQVGLARVPPGHYVLTVVVTDPMADKNNQTQARSIDFTVAH